MRIETQISEKEYLSLMMNLFFRKPSFLFFSIIGIILFFCYLFNLNLEGQASTPVYYLLFALYFLVINPVIFYLNIKKQISKNTELTEKIIYNFSEQHIEVKGETFTGEISWTNIKAIKESKDCFFIHQTGKVLNFITKKSLGPNLDEFRLFIHNKGL